MTTLIGRDSELEALLELVSGHRLVTVTGAPGIGKSHLAVHVADRLRATGGFEVVVVNVAAVADAKEVVAAVGTARAGLVVLDDCDHLVDACAQLAESLLAANVGVLATSREPLRTPTEVIWRLAPLSLPPDDSPAVPEALADSEAVQLFCDRSSAVAQEFTPTPENIAFIVEICRRLDGLPLAIELAAARMGVLSPAEIAAHLDDPLRFLTRGQRTAPTRHQSLRTALEWSWDVLAPSERVLLGRLSIFAGSFPADAACEVATGDEVAADDAFDLLSGLVEKSLLMAEAGGRGTRYRLLGVIRHFASEKLAEGGEAQPVAARHGAWCVDLVLRAGDPGAGRPWLELVEPETDEIVAAFERAAANGHAEVVARLVMARVLLLRARGDHGVAHAVLDRAMPLVAQAPARLRASVFRDAGAAATSQCNFAVAAARLREAVAAARECDDPALLARVQAMSGFVSVRVGDVDAGFRALDEAVTLARSVAQRYTLAQTLGVYARARLLVGDIASARRAFAESGHHAQGAGNRGMLAHALAGLGSTAIMGGQYSDAEHDLTEALALGKEIGETYAVVLALAGLGELARLQGDEEQAEKLFLECLHQADGAPVPFARAKGLLGLGRLAQATGDAAGAQEWFGEALSLARAHHLFELLAPSLHGLAQVARAAGAEERAQAMLEEALDSARRCLDEGGQALALDELARMVAARSDHRRAGALHRQALPCATTLATPPRWLIPWKAWASSGPAAATWPPLPAFWALLTLYGSVTVV